MSLGKKRINAKPRKKLDEKEHKPEGKKRETKRVLEIVPQTKNIMRLVDANGKKKRRENGIVSQAIKAARCLEKARQAPHGTSKTIKEHYNEDYKRTIKTNHQGRA